MFTTSIYQKNTYRFAALVLCVGLFFTQCKNNSPASPAAAPNTDETNVSLTDAQFKSAGIETTQLLQRDISTTLKLNGRIDMPPQNLVSVSVPLGGYLKTTGLLPGMKVSKGQVIAVLEDPQYVQLQQDYLHAKAKLDYAVLDYNRQKTLNQSQASSDKTMQQAQTEMGLQQINMSAIGEKLKLINIDPQKLAPGNISRSIKVYSPINGIVSKVNVNVGKYVVPSDVVFELIDPSDIHLNLKAYEKDVALLSIGQKLIAYSNAEPDKTYAAEIMLISKDVNSEGFTEVHCHMQPYHPHLLPGMYMNAQIKTMTTSAKAIPLESVVSFEGKTFVFVETGRQQYALTPVSTGAMESEFVAVENADALKGKNIVSKGAYTLLMKLKNTTDSEE